MPGEGKVVEITAIKGASQRTKNRIREHGPMFSVREVRQSVLAMGHKPCVLVGSADGWFGWLLLDELQNQDALLANFSN